MREKNDQACSGGRVWNDNGGEKNVLVAGRMLAMCLRGRHGEESGAGAALYWQGD